MDCVNNSKSEVTHDFPGFFKVYKNGHVERYDMSQTIMRDPPAEHLMTHAQTKEVAVSSETGVKACVFLPANIIEDKPGQKLPLLVHFHGGAFCAGSPFQHLYQAFLKTFVNIANIVAISVDYRLAPEHPLPTAHEDSFEALKWIAGHVGGNGPDPWINEHADLDRVFLCGESAGGNIAHYVAVKAGTTNLTGLNLVGSIIVDPYFGCKEPDQAIKYMYPNSSGTDSDPVLCAGADPDLGKMAVGRVLVCLAEKDFLRDRGATYYHTLCGGAWKGKVELFESVGEGHCSFLFDNNDKTRELFKRISDFINHQ